MRDIETNKVMCPYCGSLQTNREYCYKCGLKLCMRKPYSLIKTFSYAFSALILLIPANLLPMMIVHKLTNTYQNTIYDGIMFFIKEEDYFIALIIFLASIVIPIFKIIVLFWLLLMAKLKKFQKFSLKLYKIIAFIGKFSMIDVFVTAVMVGFLQFDNLIYVEAGEGVIPFTMVVIFTMLATNSFDTRLLFDKGKK